VTLVQTEERCKRGEQEDVKGDSRRLTQTENDRAPSALSADELARAIRLALWGRAAA
jgi:hypothetical protein